MENRPMKTDDIQREIIVVPTGERLRFVRGEGPFVNPFSTAQVRSIVEENRAWGRVVENGTGIRLNALRDDGDATTLEISPVSFHDFISTNMLLLGNPVIDRQVGKVLRRWMSYRTPAEVLGDSSLSNLLTVSVLIADAIGDIGIAERTERVAVNPGYCGVTVTATPNLEDYHSDDPLRHCVLRETMEELNIDELHNVEFQGMIIGLQKLQPVALYSARLEGRWDDYSEDFKNAPDHELEFKRLLVMDDSELFDSMEKRDYTVVARYQIARYFNLL
jgi:hypothetical protein